jgi:hypothetical protein
LLPPPTGVVVDELKYMTYYKACDVMCKVVPCFRTVVVDATKCMTEYMKDYKFCHVMCKVLAPPTNLVVHETQYMTNYKVSDVMCKVVATTHKCYSP